jgi:phosphoribosyl 1,2-cyclic phosphodiesterase
MSSSVQKVLKQMEVVVLGSGPSSAIPSMRCLLNSTCKVCHEAHQNIYSKNNRLNPSILIRSLESDEQHLLIDCGKTFRESVLKTFPKIDVKNISGVVLTHGHADACLGMDDLREVQTLQQTQDPITKEWIKNAPDPLVVYCSQKTKLEIQDKFDYLMEKVPPSLPSSSSSSSSSSSTTTTTYSDEKPTPKEAVYRWIAQLRFKLFDSFVPFELCGIKLTPLPVLHGRDYLSHGFEFGEEADFRFVYLSDVSEIIPETLEFLLDPKKKQIDVLMIDALYLDKCHGTHMNLEAVLQEARQIQPKRTLLTGMSHDFDYEITNQQLQKYLKEENLLIEMAYDGLRIPMSTNNR